MSQTKSAYLRAVAMLAKRAHSSFELRRKLKSRHSSREIDEALSKLVRQGFLDDAQFAVQRARLCRLDKAWGDQRIRLDLQSHKIAGASIAKALATVEEEQSESQALQRILDNWLRLRGRPENVRDLKKLHDRCLRMGYRPELVRTRLAPYFRSLEWDPEA